MLASLKDAAGSIEFEPDLLQKYVLSFGQRFPSNQQPEYVRHKIVLYDRMPNAAKQGPSPQYVLNDSKTFKILHFDVNSLAFESNFPINKFLVYNDAYSKFWRVVINGRKEKIFLANEAFKGIFLPAGRNLVQLRYCPYGGEWVYIIVLITNCLSFIYLLFLNFNFKGRR